MYSTVRIILLYRILEGLIEWIMNNRSGQVRSGQVVLVLQVEI